MAAYPSFRHLTGNAHRLAVARELARIYSEVLQEPVPAELEHLIRGLEGGAASAAQ
jgi:hypothetical protein